MCPARPPHCPPPAPPPDPALPAPFPHPPPTLTSPPLPPPPPPPPPPTPPHPPPPPPPSPPPPTPRATAPPPTPLPPTTRTVAGPDAFVFNVHVVMSGSTETCSQLRPPPRHTVPSSLEKLACRNRSGTRPTSALTFSTIRVDCFSAPIRPIAVRLCAG